MRFKLVLRLTNGGTFHIEFNGIDITTQMKFPTLGGKWQNWQTLFKNSDFEFRSTIIMKIVMDTNGANWKCGKSNLYSYCLSGLPAPTPTQSPVVSGAFLRSTNGNDANPGTIAAMENYSESRNTLKAGQTVYVKKGT